jgi:DNA-binding CsgD family transcriptional regulator
MDELLTPREQEVYNLLLEGLSPKEIAKLEY